MASPTDRIAAILNSDREGAREFARQVSEHLGYQVKYIKIIEALEALPPERHFPILVKQYIAAQDGNESAPLDDEALETMRARLETALGEPPSARMVRRAVRYTGPEPSEQAFSLLLQDLHILSQLADALEMPVEDTWDYADDTRDNHIWPLTYADLLAGIAALGEAPKRTLSVLNSLALHIISRELDIDREQAKNLSAEISKTIGREIDEDDLLQTLIALGPQVTEDDVWYHYLEEALPVLELADVLESTAAEARQWLEMAQSNTAPYEVTAAEVAKVLSETGEDSSVLDNLLPQILSNRLADALGLTGDSIRLFSVDYQRRTGRSIDYGQLLAAVPDFQLPSGEIDHLGFLRAWYVAAATNRSLTGAMWFIHTLRATLDARDGTELSFPQLEQALDALAGQPVTVESVISYIRGQELQAILNLDVEGLTDLTNAIEAAIGAPVDNEQLAKVAKQLEEATPQAVLEQFETNHRTIRQIAQALNVTPRTARDAMREIGSGLQRAVTEKEVLQLLQGIRPERRTVQTVLFFLKLADLAAELETDAQLFREQYDNILEEFPAAEPTFVVDALRATATTGTAIQETAALVKLSLALDAQIRQTTEFLKGASQQAGKTVNATDALRALRVLPVGHKHEAGVATFVMLAERVASNSSDDKRVGELTGTILRDKSRIARFKQLWATCPEEQRLTLHDARHLFGVAAWPQMTLRLVSPQTEEGEQWLSYTHLQQLLERRSRHNGHVRSGTQAKKLQQECWQQIVSPERAYDVPSRGRAEILAGERLSSTLGLHSLRFVREGASAPGLFVQFKFGEPAHIGIMRIAANGATEGFHQLIGDDWVRELMAAIALAHYRDLVLPARSYRYIPSSNSSSRRQRIRYSSGERTRQNRSLPRTRHAKPRKRTYQLEDWYESQERARHTVTGHLRWVGSDFVAEPDKQRQARSAGVKLPTGYTWVVEHERGNPQQRGRIQLDDRYDLLLHTIFRPPAQATSQLERLLR